MLINKSQLSSVKNFFAKEEPKIDLLGLEEKRTNPISGSHFLLSLSIQFRRPNREIKRSYLKKKKHRSAQELFPRCDVLPPLQ